MSTKPIQIVLCSWLLCGALLGCGGYKAADHKVEGTSARRILEDVLTGWKDGKSVDEWQEKKPPIVVQDMDWKGGAKLESFEILGDGEAIDANLHCRVKLKLKMPNNSKADKTVEYLVGTSPVATVFRAMGP
ncbi:MAG: hypothetical protein U0892_13900 [Pirellulales bacterium]